MHPPCFVFMSERLSMCASTCSCVHVHGGPEVKVGCLPLSFFTLCFGQNLSLTFGDSTLFSFEVLHLQTCGRAQLWILELQTRLLGLLHQQSHLFSQQSQLSLHPHPSCDLFYNKHKHRLFQLKTKNTYLIKP